MFFRRMHGGNVIVTGASEGDSSGGQILDFVTIKYVVQGPSLFITRSNALVVIQPPGIHAAPANSML